MAADTLRQVGKNLKKTSDDTDFTIKRVRENFPLIERLRDSFDSEHPFDFDFYTQKGPRNVTITIKFMEIFVHNC